MRWCVFRFNLRHSIAVAGSGADLPIVTELPARRGAFLLTAVLGLAIAVAAPHAQAYSPPKAALIVDANSGRTLYASNADVPRYPASLTKVMTLYMLFAHLGDGRLDMGTKLTISAEAASRPPSKVGFKPGDSITVRAAIRLLMTKSANDVAAAVAENIAGSEAEFARLMTRKAHALGMTDTTFRNASGLPHSEQKTTAQDMAILARRVLSDFPQYADEFKLRYAEFRGKTYRNHNRLLFRYKGVIGLKTGFIRDSGFNVMVAAQRGDKRLYGVVMGGRSAAARDARAQRLLDAAWKKASVRAPEMAAHLPQRNPAFAPSPREHDIRRRFASADGAPSAMLFKHIQASAQPEKATAGEAPPQKNEARLGGAARPAPQQSGSTDSRRPAEPRGLAGPYHVQVGAYVSADDARRRLETVSAKSDALLRHRPHQAVSAMISGKEVYRARFGGFEKAQARQTCDKLKRKSVDCLVLGAN